MSDNDIFRRKADEMIDRRLAGIEEELKMVRELMEQVVRNEERMTALLAAQSRTERQVDDLEKRVRLLELTDTKQTHSLGALERFFWIAVASIAAWIGAHFK